MPFLPFYLPRHKQLKIVIVGGGYIAAEFSHIFGSYGTRVTVVSRGAQLLRHEDAEVSARFTELVRPRVDLHTDSKYVMTGITEWIRGWKARGWVTADKKPVKNADLWQRLDAARARHDVRWRWVKGHAGHELNERADSLANKGVSELPRR